MRAAASTSRRPPSVAYRAGRPSDAPRIAAMVAAERMNPLGLDPTRFLVATPPADDADLLCVGQLQQLNESLYEVRSLVAAPSARGAGLGADMLARLVAAAPRGATVCLTTIAKRAPFYERAGFRRVGLFSRRELWLEAAAGTVVARLAAGDRLVAMEATAE